MISRYTVWLNDVSLAEIDPNIYVADINYQAASLARSTGRLAALDGQFSGDKDYIDANKIVVNFVVREYSTQRRQEIVQNVIAWASKGGWLKTSDRVGQKIYVKPTRFPAVSSALNWLDNLTVEFTAFDYPFWVDEVPQKITIANGASGQIFLPGTRRSYVEAEITATQALTSLGIVCGNTSLALSGLSVPAGGVVKVAYTDAHHILEIKQGNTSLLDKRTATSNDDLVAELGANNVSFTASGTASCSLFARGVYI